MWPYIEYCRTRRLLASIRQDVGGRSWRMLARSSLELQARRFVGGEGGTHVDDSDLGRHFDCRDGFDLGREVLRVWQNRIGYQE